MPLAALLLLCLPALAPSPAWHDPAAWQALEPGRSAFDVQRSLGRPAATRELPNGSEVWHYQLAADGTARTDRGLVVLKPVGSGSRTVLRVARIKLPDFEALPAPAPEPQPAVPAPAPAPVLPAIRPAPAPKPTVRISPPPPPAARQSDPPPMAVKSKKENLGGKYFTWLGIASIASGLIIALIKPISEHFS